MPRNILGGRLFSLCAACCDHSNQSELRRRAATGRCHGERGSSTQHSTDSNSSTAAAHAERTQYRRYKRCWGPCRLQLGSVCVLKVQTITSTDELYTTAAAAAAAAAQQVARRITAGSQTQDCFFFIFLSYHTELPTPVRIAKCQGDSNLEARGSAPRGPRPQEMPERAVRRSILPDARAMPDLSVVFWEDLRSNCFVVCAFHPLPDVPRVRFFPLEFDSRTASYRHCTHVTIARCSSICCTPP